MDAKRVARLLYAFDFHGVFPLAFDDGLEFRT
jgi:hypothetical protein